MSKSVRGGTLTLPNELHVGRVPMDFQIFKARLQESKPIGLKISLYQWKVIEM
jgi:hypothetical protein